MSKFIPLFPLNMVAYPEEKINLHVFEPRYKQLVNDCTEGNLTFGIPAYLDERVSEYGTEMRITSIEKRYDDGRMDIRTLGVRVFVLQDFQNPAPGKLYAGGEVEPQHDSREEDPNVRAALLFNLEQLYSLLNVKMEVKAGPGQSLSYDLAHRIGLSQAQEYELLTIGSETERQQFLSDHLMRTIPVVSEIERTKARIRMNGHFKQFDPLDF
ncbi:MAG: LON peptidase substrate-binding domain-containing protein [Catalinimonas sp.]